MQIVTTETFKIIEWTELPEYIRDTIIDCPNNDTYTEWNLDYTDNEVVINYVKSLGINYDDRILIRVCY